LHTGSEEIVTRHRNEATEKPTGEIKSSAEQRAVPQQKSEHFGIKEVIRGLFRKTLRKKNIRNSKTIQNEIRKSSSLTTIVIAEAMGSGKIP
jgi:hypothetical protein